MALKTYMQVELNDYLQEQMESELFAGVDEMEKSQFLGNFFHWMRNIFMQTKREDVTPLLEKDKERPVEMEPIVSSDLQIRDSSDKPKSKKQAKKRPSLAQSTGKSKENQPLAEFNEAEKLKRRKQLIGEELQGEKAPARPHPTRKKLNEPEEEIEQPAPSVIKE